MTTTPRMMPGQEPYTPAEYAALVAAVADAAAGDPGEAGEPTTWTGWCDGSRHEPWHVYGIEPHAAEGIYRAVGQTAAEAEAKVRAAFPKTRRLRLYVQDEGLVRCWRYAGQPDPHDYLPVEHNDEQTGKIA